MYLNVKIFKLIVRPNGRRKYLCHNREESRDRYRLAGLPPHLWTTETRSKTAWLLAGNFSWISSKIRIHIYKHSSFLWLIYYFPGWAAWRWWWDKSIIVNTGSRILQQALYKITDYWPAISWSDVNLCECRDGYILLIFYKISKYPYQLHAPPMACWSQIKWWCWATLAWRFCHKMSPNVSYLSPHLRCTW